MYTYTYTCTYTYTYTYTCMWPAPPTPVVLPRNSDASAVRACAVTLNGDKGM